MLPTTSPRRYFPFMLRKNTGASITRAGMAVRGACARAVRTEVVVRRTPSQKSATRFGASWSRVADESLTPLACPPDSPVGDACAVGRERDASIVPATFTPPAVDACSWTTMAGLQSYVDRTFRVLHLELKAVCSLLTQNGSSSFSRTVERLWCVYAARLTRR